MLFEPFQLRKIQLANRLVMSPLTRSRAVHDNTPNALMATYYAQRATAGLIITEGTSPSPNGLGYARIPGLFNSQHVAGWKLVTDAVHAKGGRIVVQLMHTGRVSHQANLPAGAEVLSASADACPGEMWTDVQGSQPHTPPRAMTAADIATTIGEYVQAARVTGVAPLRIMARHVLPNVTGPVLVLATIQVAAAILTEATLSFLGVGVPPTSPSLGTLIRIGNDTLFSGDWWITIFPGLMLVLIALSVNLLGDWLRDALNPKLQ